MASTVRKSRLVLIHAAIILATFVIFAVGGLMVRKTVNARAAATSAREAARAARQAARRAQCTPTVQPVALAEVPPTVVTDPANPNYDVLLLIHAGVSAPEIFAAEPRNEAWARRIESTFARLLQKDLEARSFLEISTTSLSSAAPEPAKRNGTPRTSTS